MVKKIFFISVTLVVVFGVFSRESKDSSKGNVDIVRSPKDNEAGSGNPHDYISKLADSFLAFPEFSEDYLRKILPRSGDFQVMTQAQINGWASSQGIAVSQDLPFNGLQYQRAIYFTAPGLRFALSAPKDDLGKVAAFGQALVLDFALFQEQEKAYSLSSEYRHYENIQEIDIYVDKIFYKKLTQGFGKSVRGPVVIQLPFIRDNEGQIVVELVLKNHPSNFAILYDASVTDAKKINY